MGLQDYSEVDEATRTELSTSKSEKRKPAILPPWDLPSAKLLRNGKKSPIEDIQTYEELWDHCKESTPHQLYMSEFASGDPIVRGVAISRTAQGVASVCQAILQGDDAENLKSILKDSVYKEMEKEAKLLLPHCKQLDGSGLPSKVEKAMKRVGAKQPVWKDKDEVTASIEYFRAWLKKPSQLRKHMNILQLGGLFYTTHVDILIMCAYMKCEGEGTIADDAIARLCQAKAYAAGTRIKHD